MNKLLFAALVVFSFSAWGQGNSSSDYCSSLGFTYGSNDYRYCTTRFNIYADEVRNCESAKLDNSTAMWGTSGSIVQSVGRAGLIAEECKKSARDSLNRDILNRISR